MRYEPEIHHRRSIRLKGYDYSQAGMYFVTICTQNRRCLFGAIVDGKMRLNSIGHIVYEQWNAIGQRFPMVELDEYVVMPNHIHGLFAIVGAPVMGAQSGTVAIDDQPRTTAREATARVGPTGICESAAGYGLAVPRDDEERMI